MLSIEDIRSSYGRIEVLHGVSVEVNESEVVALIGANGAGKTTFIKILLGIIKKSAGSATMLGFPAGSRKGRSHIGYLPEQLRMPRHHTGNSAMEMYGNLSNVSTRVIRERRDELMELVALALP